MSEEGSYGFNFIEKLFGFIIFLVGVTAMYYTVTSMEALGAFTGMFGLLSAVFILLGLLITIAKTE